MVIYEDYMIPSFCTTIICLNQSTWTNKFSSLCIGSATSSNTSCSRGKDKKKLAMVQLFWSISVNFLSRNLGSKCLHSGGLKMRPFFYSGQAFWILILLQKIKSWCEHLVTIVVFHYRTQLVRQLRQPPRPHHPHPQARTNPHQQTPLVSLGLVDWEDLVQVKVWFLTLRQL